MWSAVAGGLRRAAAGAALAAPVARPLPHRLTAARCLLAAARPWQHAVPARPALAAAPATPRAPPRPGGGVTGHGLGAVRGKQTKRQSYYKPARSDPCGQRENRKARIGPKAMPSEYVEAGRVICQHRKFLPKNPHVTRKRHFKTYPGVNVKVMKNTSLQAACSGRIKMTHDVKRDVMIMNVLAEPREELLRDELWRYRTEHVENMEENRYVCSLRAKAWPVFGKSGGWVNPPQGPKPMRCRISYGNDIWNNLKVQDPLEIEPYAYPLPRSLLERHIKQVRRRHAGVPDEENDPQFSLKDTRYHLFKGQTAQR